MTKKLIFIFQTCIEIDYYSRFFRITKTIILKKIEKNDQIFFKSYRSIVLLNTMNKILKSIIINKIIELAKKNSLLSKSQMNVRKKKTRKRRLKC